MQENIKTANVERTIPSRAFNALNSGTKAAWKHKGKIAFAAYFTALTIAAQNVNSTMKHHGIKSDWEDFLKHLSM